MVGPTCIHQQLEVLGLDPVSTLVKSLHPVLPLVLGQYVVEPKRAVSHQFAASMRTHGQVVLHRDHQVDVSPPHVLDHLTLHVCQVGLQRGGLAAPHADYTDCFSCCQGSKAEKANDVIVEICTILSKSINAKK